MLLWCWTLIKESFLPRNLSLWSNVGETGVRLISSVTRYVISSVNSLTSITLVILSGAFEWACKIACKSGAALDSSGGKRWEVAENVFVSTTCWSTLNWHAGCTVQRQVAELSSKRFGRQHITTGVWVRTSHLKCMEQRASKSFRMNHETTKSIWGRLWPPILSHIESPAKSVPLPTLTMGTWLGGWIESWRIGGWYVMICWITLLRICSAFSSSDGGKQVADAGPNLSFRRHLPPLAATHRQPVPKKNAKTGSSLSNFLSIKWLRLPHRASLHSQSLVQELSWRLQSPEKPPGHPLELKQENI